MTIEITEKKNVKAPVWSIILLVLAAILIIAAVLHYLYLSGQIKNLSGKLATSPSERALEEDVVAKEKEINTINSKIGIFNRIILSHQDAGRVFNFFEKMCLKNVWFSSFSLNQEAATISGNADNFVTLEQQIILFKKQPVIKAVTLSGARMNKEGGVDFSFIINFNPQVFRQ